jgi:hypothetical protein
MSKMRNVALAGAVAMGAFGMMGPLQHVGAIPQTSVGDASKAVLKLARNSVISPAFAACGPGGGNGNNGVGNGVDPQPPGNPPINDGTGTGPGNPGNKGGARK